MKLSVLIIILDFVILVCALVLGIFDIGCQHYAYSNVLVYSQFIDSVVYGYLLVIFFVCVSVMAKEEIQPKMTLTIYFSAAVLYFLLSFLLMFFFESGDHYIVELVFALALGGLHLAVALLHIFKEI